MEKLLSLNVLLMACIVISVLKAFKPYIIFSFKAQEEVSKLQKY